MVREGLALSAVDHALAVDDLHAQSASRRVAFESADVVLCPTLNVLPPKPGSLSASRGTVDAFFDVEFATTGWTAVANADRLGSDLAATWRGRRAAGWRAAARA